MRYPVIFAALLAVAAALPAAAETIYSSEEMNLRAGPGGGYPLVGKLPEGSPMQVYGCDEGQQWCDVSASGLRGWISAQKLDHTPVAPVVNFDEQSYWMSNYYTSDFYRSQYGYPDTSRGPGWRREGNHWVGTRNFGSDDYDHDGIPNIKDKDDDGDGISDDRDLDRDNDHFVDVWNRSDLYSRRLHYRD
jgi:uncharacterized protein YraI